MGIASKCLEVLRNRNSTFHGGDDRSRPGSRLTNDEDELDDGPGDVDEEEEDDDDDDDAPDDDDDDDDRGEVDNTESEEDDNDNAGDGVTDDEIEASDGHAKLRRREIRYYDVKVALLKARHGML